MIKFIVVGLGGFLGATGRYLIGKMVYKIAPQTLFPYSTFTVNMLGCFLFGFLLILAEYKQLLTPELRLFLLVGFLGSLTTFSTYSFDSFHMLRTNHFLIMAANILIQTALGIVFLWLGYLLGTAVIKGTGLPFQ